MPEYGSYIMVLDCASRASTGEMELNYHLARHGVGDMSPTLQIQTETLRVFAGNVNGHT